MYQISIQHSGKLYFFLFLFVTARWRKSTSYSVTQTEQLGFSVTDTKFCNELILVIIQNNFFIKIYFSRDKNLKSLILHTSYGEKRSWDTFSRKNLSEIRWNIFSDLLLYEFEAFRKILSFIFFIYNNGCNSWPVYFCYYNELFI